MYLTSILTSLRLISREIATQQARPNAGKNAADLFKSPIEYYCWRVIRPKLDQLGVGFNFIFV